ncbi:MAG: hypothetical protein QM296_01915 [Bacillota bacterium]|nr:hypothetical protein [Bacillota bacterium]
MQKVDNAPESGNIGKFAQEVYKKVDIAPRTGQYRRICSKSVQKSRYCPANRAISKFLTTPFGSNWRSAPPLSLFYSLLKSGGKRIDMKQSDGQRLLWGYGKRQVLLSPPLVKTFNAWISG